MLDKKQQTDHQEQEIQLLKEWLPKISREYLAYIKGAAQALLFAQEEQGEIDYNNPVV